MKRILLTFFLILSASVSGFSQSALVGSVSQNTATTSTSVVVTLAQATTAHNTLLVAVGVNANGRTFTLTDSGGGNNYTLVDNDTTNNIIGHYYRLDIPAGLTTFTFSVSGTNTTLWAIVHEVSGLATSSALDQHNIRTAAGIHMASSATGTLGQSEEYVFVYGTTGADTVTNGDDTSYTIRGQQPAAPSTRLASADKHVSVTTALTGKMLTVGSHTYFCGISTWKDATSTLRPGILGVVD
jgi:hypothetical protein